MDYVMVLGLTAGFCTTAAFAPQAWKAWKSKHTKDISLGMFVIFVIGIILWFIYGFKIDSLPVILANGVSFILASFILGLKLKYG